MGYCKLRCVYTQLISFGGRQEEQGDYLFRMHYIRLENTCLRSDFCVKRAKISELSNPWGLKLDNRIVDRSWCEYRDSSESRQQIHAVHLMNVVTKKVVYVYSFVLITTQRAERDDYVRLRTRSTFAVIWVEHIDRHIWRDRLIPYVGSFKS